MLGLCVGISEGRCNGAWVGKDVSGPLVGIKDGFGEGILVGKNEGLCEGNVVGKENRGYKVGIGVGF